MDNVELYAELKGYWKSIHSNVSYEIYYCNHSSKLQEMCLKNNNNISLVFRYSKRVYLSDYINELEFINAYM